jgi:hypothetical protein
MDKFFHDLLVEYTLWFHENGFDLNVPRPSWVADTAATNFVRNHRISIHEFGDQKGK